MRACFSPSRTTHGEDEDVRRPRRRVHRSEGGDLIARTVGVSRHLHLRYDAGRWFRACRRVRTSGWGDVWIRCPCERVVDLDRCTGGIGEACNGAVEAQRQDQFGCLPPSQCGVELVLCAVAECCTALSSSATWHRRFPRSSSGDKPARSGRRRAPRRNAVVASDLAALASCSAHGHSVLADRWRFRGGGRRARSRRSRPDSRSVQGISDCGTMASRR